MRTKAKELREEIIEYLLTNLSLNGKKKITEGKIASKFKVSRTPVREVLKILESEGIISGRRNSGIKIRKFTKEDIESVYDVRILIETYAIKKTIKNIKEKDIKELKTYVKKYNQARRERKDKEAKRYDILFHEKIVDHCGNWYLKHLIKKLYMFPFFMSLPKKSISYKIDPNPYSHNKILKALIKKDTEKASKIIKKHILWIKEYTLKKFKKEVRL
ncbi:MAG: GntR family transcriptional regulator [Candidatus Omnitrophica bacterium]|nr:GntR family transcriptional regulator [Candidatus Omnitrophota bacterium]MCM8803262.1 GntR family transcriptional regulator [Candidatus Omnitrophota bacterium]